MRSVLAALCIVASGSAGLASGETEPVSTTVAGEVVRVFAPSGAALRVSIVSGGGNLYDSGWREGNTLDWPVVDSAGHALGSGTYRVRVDVRAIDGSITTREQLISIVGRDIQLEGQEPLSSIMLLAHDGERGSLVTTRGDFTLRFGDFLHAQDREWMRVTSDGRVGIGTSVPLARLDVEGTIRTTGGIVFPDGTVQQTAATPGVRHPPFRAATNVAGTGVQNRIARWVDNEGTLGNSNLFELNGRIGVGTATPTGNLHIFGGPAEDLFSGMGLDLADGPAMNYGYSGHTFGRGSGFFNVRPDAAAVAPNPSLRFMTVNAQRMIITNTGNVGIGVTNPAQRLEVAGNVKVSGGGSFVFNDGTSMATAGATLGSNTFTGNQNVTGDIISSGNIKVSGTGNGFRFADGTSMTTAGASLSANTFTGNQSVSGNVNATGTVTGSVIGASTQFNLSGQRILSNPGTDTLFVGAAAGSANTTGQSNVFLGPSSGTANTTGLGNTFVGAFAGFSNAGGSANAYFGSSAGVSFKGDFNVFVGTSAARGANGGGTGDHNTAVGGGAAYRLGAGSGNAMFGYGVGSSFVAGDENTMLGDQAGSNVTAGNGYTLVGAFANALDNLTNATAIGTESAVYQSNSLILGKSGTSVGIGTVAPWARLDVRNGDVNVGMETAPDFAVGSNSLFIANDNGDTNNNFRIDGANNTLYLVAHSTPGAATGTKIVFRTAAAGGSENDRMSLDEDGRLNINNATGSADPSAMLDVNGHIRGTFATATSGVFAICMNSNGVLVNCSASSLRYKDDVSTLTGGLDTIKRLRPVSFRWKEDASEDIGLIAEEVANVEPRLALRNAAGEIAGVRYDRLGIILLGAIKEQQDELVKVRSENARLLDRLESLERAIARAGHEH